MLTGGFQDAVRRWCYECFGVAITHNQLERIDRFVEEALELGQTFDGFTAARAHALVDYVFSRQVGERQQEIGGVAVTLAALATASDLIISTCANRELKRICEPENVAKIREKQKLKADIPMPPKCPVGSCQRHNKCMYFKHPRCPLR